MTGNDPFSDLGLPARADLSDDEVRAAWRRIAAATHPDRSDGGDAARFAAAAAAYAELRTPYGRSEAYADLNAEAPAAVRAANDATSTVNDATSTVNGTASQAAASARHDGTSTGGGFRLATFQLATRVRTGRPGMLALRVLLAAAVSWACVAVAGWQPATLAITTGALIWLIRTTRHDLAPVP
jgi:DnaJ-class molecular chaperone